MSSSKIQPLTALNLALTSLTTSTFPITSLSSPAITHITHHRQHHKSSRSYSFGSSSTLSSTGSTTSSRSASDVLDLLVATEPQTSIHLWSAGNVRIDKRDLTMRLEEVHELISALTDDERFELVDVVHLDDSGADWKASYRRSIVTPVCTPVSETA